MKKTRGNRKTKKARKSKKARIGGSGKCIKDSRDCYGGSFKGPDSGLVFLFCPFWDFLWAIPPVRLGLSEDILEKFRKDPGNALRAFPGIPLGSTAGIPKPYNSRHLRLPEHFQNSLPQYGWGRLFFQKWFRRGPSRAAVMEFTAVWGGVYPILDLLRSSRFFSGIFPIGPFLFRSLLKHLRGTVPKGSATQSGPFPEKVGNPPAIFSSVDRDRGSPPQVCNICSKTTKKLLQSDFQGPSQTGSKATRK